jgi:HD-GYP domain-containing protein (c-di-GMP phosphodiesterase class II)
MIYAFLVTFLVLFTVFNYVCFFKDRHAGEIAGKIFLGFFLSPAGYYVFSRLLNKLVCRLISLAGNIHSGLEADVVRTICIFCICLLPLPLFNLLYSRLIGQQRGLSLFIYVSFMMIEFISLMISPVVLIRFGSEIMLFLLWFLLFRKDIIFLAGHAWKINYHFFCSAGLILLAVTIGMEIVSPYIMKAVDRKFETVFSVWLSSTGILIFLLFLLLTKSNFVNIHQAVTIQTNALKEAEISRDMLSAQESVIVSFVEILESKSGETGNHVKRVSEYSRILAADLGFAEHEVENIRVASMMHDIGKLMISNEILEKKGKLTPEEQGIMRQHVLYGEMMLKNASGEIMRYARLIASQHHEYWNGSGYPRRLSGGQINLVSRIVAIADVFDALVSRRSYKDSWNPEDAKSEIIRRRGIQFAPECVDSFVRSYGRILTVMNEYPDIS